MIAFDGFTITCDECGEISSVGVEDVFDGDALITAKCSHCDNIERIQSEIYKIEED